MRDAPDKKELLYQLWLKPKRPIPPPQAAKRAVRPSIKDSPRPAQRCLPPEFRRENEDLNMPRTDDELLERLENLYLFRPFF